MSTVLLRNRLRLLPGGRNWLLATLAAVLVALAVAALGLAAAAHRAAGHFGETIGASATLSVIAEEAEIEAQARAALDVLRETPGILEIRVLEPDEQRALLAPWLGTEIAFDGVSLPLMIDVTADPATLDAAALGSRLAEAAPAAVFDDHGAWRLPFLEAAERQRWAASLAALLLLFTLAGAAALAARATLAAAAPAVATLVGLGMSDRAIAAEVEARLRPALFAGAVLGAALGILLAGAGGTVDTASAGAGFAGWTWLLPPLAALAGVVAGLAGARIASRLALRRQP
jgi:cell division transport system permease protein